MRIGGRAAVWADWQLPTHLGRRRCLAILALAALNRCQAKPPVSSLSAGDVADIARIEAYLDTLHTLTARVLQIWPNGAAAAGTLWLERPGRLRIQYDPPYSATLVAANGLVVFHDSARNSTTSLPLLNTPLSILLSDRIRLSGDVTVTHVQRQVGTVQISMIQTRRPATGSLTLIFAEAPLRLASIDLLDSRDQETRVRLTNLQSGEPFDQSLFQIAAPLEPRDLGQ